MRKLNAKMRRPQVGFTPTAGASEPVRLIGVLVPRTSTGAPVESRSAEFLQGLHEELRPSHPCVIRVGTTDIDPEVPLGWEPDGMVVWSEWGKSRDLLKRARMPMVKVADPSERRWPGTVRIDETAVGRMAGRFLLDHGWRSFGFVGLEGSVVARLRGKGFAEQVQSAGCGCDVYRREEFGYRHGEPFDWVRGGKRSQAWLGRLPKRTAVFAWNDQSVRLFAESALRLGMSIPRDMAFLGADGNATICEMSHPTITSVCVPYRELGRQAARLLWTWLETRRRPASVTLEPTIVIDRESTGHVPLDDEMVDEAIQFIREHLAEPMNAEALVVEFGVSRRTLENRFRAAIGSTPLQEIHRQRIERARQLLVQEGKTIEEVARRVGFASARRFRATFRKLTGQTPKESISDRDPAP